jgi:hypothetical protein
LIAVWPQTPDAVCAGRRVPGYVYQDARTPLTLSEDFEDLSGPRTRSDVNRQTGPGAVSRGRGVGGRIPSKYGELRRGWNMLRGLIGNPTCGRAQDDEDALASV